MQNTTMTAAAVTTAKDDLAAAETRMRELAEERNRTDGEIREAHALIARQKSEAARSGDSFASVPAEMDADHLRQRREELPYELYAQEIYIEEAKLALYAAQDADRLARHEEAEAAFAEVKNRYEAVKKEYDDASAARIDPTRGTHASYTRKLAVQTLAELEASPPAVGEDHSPGAARKRVIARDAA